MFGEPLFAVVTGQDCQADAPDLGVGRTTDRYLDVRLPPRMLQDGLDHEVGITPRIPSEWSARRIY